MKSYLSIIIIFSVFLGFNSGCSSKKTPNKTIIVGINKSMITSLMWLAKEKEYFKDEGINVEFKTYYTGKRAMQGFLKHDVDLALMAEAPFVIESF